MNILCTGGALPREESLRKEDKSEKKTGVRKCNLFSSVTVAINKKKRKKETTLRGGERGREGRGREGG